MPESTNEPTPPKFTDPETALGGADAVEKTTYVVGKGTTPEANVRPGETPSVGRRGPGIVLIVVIILAIAIAAVYVLSAGAARG